jgi:hypothetical protein
MKKYIILSAMLTLLITDASGQNIKDLEKMQAKLPKTPPGFLSRSEKFKLVLSPGFIKPASIQKFSSQIRFEDNSYSLSFVNSQTDLFFLAFFNSSVADYQGVLYKEGTQNIVLFSYLQNQQTPEIYFVEVNIIMSAINTSTKPPAFSIYNTATLETQTVSAQQISGDNYKLSFISFMQHIGDQTSVSCSDPMWGGWVFLNSEITKLTQ